MTDELRSQAMARLSRFWNRQESDRVLVNFHRPAERAAPAGGDEHRRRREPSKETEAPLYENLPALLKMKESQLPAPQTKRLADDDDRVARIMPDVEFGCAVIGAIFGGRMRAFSTAGAWYTTDAYCEPVISDWNRLADLRFEIENEWAQKVLSCLRYFVDHATRPYALALMHVMEGANFISLMRGETQGLYDFVDHPAEVRELYELGYESGARLFEARRDTVREHNERVHGDAAYAALVPQELLPAMDTDTDAYAGPAIFEEFGLEYKQKMLDRFGGGRLHIHTLGLHLVPAAGRLESLTELSFCDDPKCPRAFDRRIEIRRDTFDTPLNLSCDLDEFAAALQERTLVGGARYNVWVPPPTAHEDLARLLQQARGYEAGPLAGRPKAAVV